MKNIETIVYLAVTKKCRGCKKKATPTDGKKKGVNV